jgi:ACS family hexuronate transporter-like MFS transporter
LLRRFAPRNDGIVALPFVPVAPSPKLRQTGLTKQYRGNIQMALAAAPALRIKGLRWWIIALVASGMAINYLARSTLSVAAPTLTGTMRLDPRQYSYVIGGFQVAYTVMQPIAGTVLDLLGTRIGFVLFAAAWSVANMLHAFAANWWQLAICRTALGATEASAIPAGLKVVGEWFPAKERSVATGWFNIGASVGAMAAPPLVVWCILTHDWRFAFVVTGAIGLAWSGLWYLLYRRPGVHFAITGEEQELIGRDRPKAEARASWREIASSRSFWGLAGARFLAEPAWNTFNFWIPFYLTTKGMDLKAIAAFAWLPFLAADLGSVLGGYLSPFYMRYFGASLLASRKLVALTGALLMAGPAFIGLAASPYVAIALFCIGGFAHQVLSGAILTTSSDVFDSGRLATANGLMGSAAWTGGLLFSLAVGQLAATIGYDALFASLVGLDLLAVVLLWRMVER